VPLLKEWLQEEEKQTGRMFMSKDRFSRRQFLQSTAGATGALAAAPSKIGRAHV
jgi:hypothetical protein